MDDRRRDETGRAQTWTCKFCGATVGMLAFARGKPPELLPRMPVMTIQGGVVWFRCTACENLIQWRIPHAA